MLNLNSVSVRCCLFKLQSDLWHFLDISSTIFRKPSFACRMAWWFLLEMFLPTNLIGQTQNEENNLEGLKNTSKKRLII